MKQVDWNLITQTSTPDISYIFLDKFIKPYDIAFTERKVEIKQVLGLHEAWKNLQAGNSVYMISIKNEGMTRMRKRIKSIRACSKN